MKVNGLSLSNCPQSKAKVKFRSVVKGAVRGCITVVYTLLGPEINHLVQRPGHWIKAVG